MTTEVSQFQATDAALPEAVSASAPAGGVGAVYRWELRARLRYYEIRVSRDLLGDVIFARSWGTIGSPTATTLAKPLAEPLLPTELRRISRERGKLGFTLVRFA